MDPITFDRLSRILASTPSRRTALGVIAGALTGLFGRTRTTTDAAAQALTCRRLGKVCVPERGLDCCAGTVCRDGRCHCPGRQRRCRGRCIPQGQCCRSADCPSGKVCRQGRCQCPASTKRCGDRCIGADACCGGCPTGQQCRGGRCTAACPALPGCTDTCSCPSGQTCLNGSCCPTADVCGTRCGCPAGQDCLSNGSCAIPCPVQDQPCTSCAQGGSQCAPETSGALYCWATGVPPTDTFCGDTSQCERGYFCYTATGFCYQLCT